MPPPSTLRSFAVDRNGKVSTHGSEGCCQFGARASSCRTAIVSLTLHGERVGELHLRFSNGTTHPPAYVVRRADGPDQPTMEEGRLLLSMVESAMSGGGWQRTSRGGPGTSHSWSNPHAQPRRR